MAKRGGVGGKWAVWVASAVLLVAGAGAQAPVDGTWVLLLGKRTLLVLSLHGAGGSAQPCGGTLASPEHLTTKDFVSFSQVSGPAKIKPLDSCVANHGTSRFVVHNSEDANDSFTYVFHVKDASHAEMAVEGVPLPPIQLVRGGSGAKVSEDWDIGRTYTPEDDAASNPEMKRIFDEDQKVRQAWPKIDWDALDKADAERRIAVRKLLQERSMHSGEDFYEAAHVFQHGVTPGDYLLAHTLSMVAVRKGYDAAIWIAAATLDRYLQSIKQPQIYGTQFFTPGTTPATQEPYNRGLISDALRRQLDVPSLAEQDVQRQKYDADRHMDAAKAAR